MNKQPECAPLSARILLSRGQLATVLAAAVLGVVDAVVLGLNHLAATVAGLLVMCYGVFELGRVVIWCADNRLPEQKCAHPDTGDLPSYTVLVPLYQDVAVFDGLLRAVRALRYPADRLQVLLLLEAEDSEMIETVRSVVLPCHFVALVVPGVGPRTRPKACNFAMSAATGEYVVIFGARDRPEPDHLLGAVSAMRSEHARPGTCRMGTIPPLGATSRHMHAPALWRISGEYGRVTFANGTERVRVPNIWDSYNVAEDADVAARLARLGYRTGIFSMVTSVAAPNRFSTALRQQTRWLQGCLMTGLVHIRRPLHSIRSMGPIRYLRFGLLTLGAPVAPALNPLMWAATLTYLIARARDWSTTIAWFETLLPPAVWYFGATVMVVGNFLFLAQVLLGTIANSDDEAGLAKRLLLTPLWWAFTSLSAYRAFWRLCTPRSRWERTPDEPDEEARARCVPKPSSLAR